ncbi:MAG: hypothetical protein R2939_04440 [Kofleriaceae bacterium]
MRAKTISMVLALAACGGADDVPLGGVTAARLPQAQAGAMSVDVEAYAEIPLHVAVDGDATEVSVTVGADVIAATAGAAAGDWIATVPVAALDDGTYPVVATAVGADGAPASASAELVVARGGVQRTVLATDGLATTPRLHRLDERVLLTWADASLGPRAAFLVELDGAGADVGAPVVLVGGVGHEDVIYARAAVGPDTVGVLYQERGTPYHTFFTIVGHDGAVALAPIALEPEGRTGSYGGDVAYADGVYHVAWRTQAGAASLDVRAMQVDVATLTAGPVVVVADTGAGDPHGGFDNISEIDVHPAGAATLVGFARYEYDATLDFELPRCQVATVDGGAVAAVEEAAIGGGFYWHWECRVRDLAGAPIAVWAAANLNSPEDNPPSEFYATRLDGGMRPERGNGTRILSAAMHRSEPAVATTARAPLMIWTDERTYVNPATGRIELRAAPLGEDLVVGAEVVFPRPRFLSGGAALSAVGVGANALMVWLDQRHGGNVSAPSSELYVGTVWQ